MNLKDSPSNGLERTTDAMSPVDRKLSVASVSSNQTEGSHYSYYSLNSQQSGESHTSSVLLNPSFSGLGKQSIQSSVLHYIKNHEHEFNTNELYEERQQSHYLGKNMTVEEDNLFSSKKNPLFSTSVGPNENFDDETDSLIEDIFFAETDSNSESNVDGDETTYIEETSHGDDSEDFYDDESDVDSEDVDDDDLLFPPSPPRSPPKELDPDKLYGLYDFSGPDPLHCTLSRNEPVYLMNDLDNYWWLIQKLSKEERVMYRRNHANTCDDENEIESDEEDGKIGFVPAECLETFGERLARLNCFKNEELEKLSKESHSYVNFTSDRLNISDEDSGSEYDKQETPTPPTTNSSEPLLIRKYSKNRGTGKAVTFENLTDVDLDLDNNQTHEVDFDSHYFGFSIHDLQAAKEEEKSSEVLSDLYPANLPLIINKFDKKTKSSLFHEKAPDEVSENSLDTYRPPNVPRDIDDISIGSFSPDTPLSAFSKSSPALCGPSNEDEIMIGRLRRSAILDQLTKVTSDLQELTFDDDDDYNNNDEV
ncbi:uncharacterized protein PRCAT00000213001 [Priceomyces carsonii]|uniref:uncharacterized protein n=1 Tax=Priceomyces carsonii TaxID=28549 RepID=UPI002EDA34CE|nr:unnamed protein product [Priceomyces carsonii]